MAGNILAVFFLSRTYIVLNFNRVQPSRLTRKRFLWTARARNNNRNISFSAAEQTELFVFERVKVYSTEMIHTRVYSGNGRS